MKGIFRSVLDALFKRERELNGDGGGLDSPSDTSTNAAYPSGSSEHVVSGAERFQRILNYWLDTELFDLPECPMDYRRKKLSEPADKFLEVIERQVEQKIKTGKSIITDDSRLLVMFQCHRAGYIAKDDERSPNYTVPLTYLVAQAMIPHWDKEKNFFGWSCSDEDQDQIVNLATIRTLYRRCRSSVPSNMRLFEWVQARLNNIESILRVGLSLENDIPIRTQDLVPRLIRINRDLADQFWPDKQSREYMLRQCQPLDSLDEPRHVENGKLTFRWRFCYYPEGSENTQIGPFYVEDLVHLIYSIDKSGINGLSHSLRAYLQGNKEQIQISSPVNQGDFFWPLTNKLIFGRWPENPAHGLSLLQSVAVNIAQEADGNSIVAVNGPPGTGKTTLLKDIIANKFVERTYELQKLTHEEDWLTSSALVEIVMRYSMVVASSNNKAVENISRELPSLSRLPNSFSDTTQHFKELAPKNDWGLFCAVLGNSTNRSTFKPLLTNLRDHMRDIKDYFKLNDFVRDLQKADEDEIKAVFTRFVVYWKNSKKLHALTSDIPRCQAYSKYNYSRFFGLFIRGLKKVEQGELAAEKFSTILERLDKEQFEIALEGIDAFKRQWFGKKLYQEHLDDKLRNAEQSFNSLFDKICDLNETFSEWQFDFHDHLMDPNSYLQHTDESPEEAEKRLQLSSPLGSSVLNQVRSELFVRALALNEALLENAASQFAKHWEKLEQLIDGRLTTAESIPEHQQLWSILFLFFPVVSSSLSSVESQFRLMQKAEAFGLAMIDEAGQAVNYHVAGLLQRSRQAIFVGDPIQLEPVVKMHASVDLLIAEDFLAISKRDGEHHWGDDYLVSSNSAQTTADRAGRYVSMIGERKVGIPLLVHRRCTEPMFSIVNKIAYNNQMVLASQPFDWPAMQSGWINVSEHPKDIGRAGYKNSKEANTAITLIEFLVKVHPSMIEGGVYIITPFSKMRRELQEQWKLRSEAQPSNDWMLQASKGNSAKSIKHFAENNIGTVHTFQGKEASTVIFCTSASKARCKQGGITWVNSKPNLINVAVTRAKHHFFVIGNRQDWSSGTISHELQGQGMRCYEGLEEFTR